MVAATVAKCKAVNADSIPEALKCERRWCLWRYEPKGPGKPTKVPYSPNGRRASSANAATWATFEEVSSAYAAGGYNGIGFVLGDGWAGVDLDGCFDDSGDLHPQAESIINRLGSYAERSPSGRGVHVLLKADGGGCVNKDKARGFGVEAYSSGRYFTITGEKLVESPATVEDARGAYAELVAEYGGRSGSAGAADVAPEWPEADPLSAERMEYFSAKFRGLEESIEGQDGSGRTIKAVCEIRRWAEWEPFGEEDGWTLLSEYNEHRCSPPWSETELRKKFRDGCVKALKADILPRRQGFDDLDDLDGPALLPASPSSLGGEPKERKRFDLELVTYTELMAEEISQTYLVDRVVVESQPLVLGGPKKGRKTGLLIDLAVSIAAGDPFLGFFDVPEPAPVIVVSGESGKATIQETARAVAELKGVDPAGRLHFGFRLPSLSECEHLIALERDIKRTGARLCAIDPAYLSVLTGKAADSAGNVFVVGNILKRFGDIGAEHDCVMALAHHTTKRTGKKLYAEPELSDLSQAGFSEFARQWILVNHMREHHQGNSLLKMVVGGSAGHEGRYLVEVEQREDDFAETPGRRGWRVEVTDLWADCDGSASEDATRKARREKVLTQLLRATEPLSQTAIRNADGKMSSDYTRTALRDLEAAGLAEQVAGKWKATDKARQEDEL